MSLTSLFYCYIALCVFKFTFVNVFSINIHKNERKNVVAAGLSLDAGTADDRHGELY